MPTVSGVLKPSDISGGEPQVGVYALTYPQLLRQAVQEGRPEAELADLRKAYDLAESFFDGFYRGQGVPFICHLVRTASLVMREGMPLHVIQAALLHSVYMLGQFEDGLCGTSESHRSFIQKAVGADAEALIFAYTDAWKEPGVLRGFWERRESLSAQEKNLLVMRIANEMEDCLDLAVLYRGGLECAARLEKTRDILLPIAEAFDLRLAGDFRQALAECRDAKIPQGLIRRYKDWYEQPERVWQKKSMKNKLKAILTKKIAAFLKAFALKRGSR